MQSAQWELLDWCRWSPYGVRSSRRRSWLFGTDCIPLDHEIPRETPSAGPWVADLFAKFWGALLHLIGRGLVHFCLSVWGWVGVELPLFLSLRTTIVYVCFLCPSRGRVLFTIYIYMYCDL